MVRYRYLQIFLVPAMALILLSGCGPHTPEEREKHTRDSLAWIERNMIHGPAYLRFHLDVPDRYRLRFYKHWSTTGSNFGCTSLNESGGRSGGEGRYPMWYRQGTKTFVVDIRPDFDGWCQDVYGVEIEAKDLIVGKSLNLGSELEIWHHVLYKAPDGFPYRMHEIHEYCGVYNRGTPDSILTCHYVGIPSDSLIQSGEALFGPSDTADIRILFKDSLQYQAPVDTIAPRGKFTDRPSHVRFVFDAPRDDQFYIQRMASTEGSPLGCPEVKHTLEYHGDSFPVPKGAKSIVVDYRPEYHGRCQKLYSLYVKANRRTTGQEIHLDGSPQFEDNNFRRVKDTVRAAPLELREYCGVYPDLPGTPVYSCRDVSLPSDLYWGGHQAAYGSNDTAVIHILFKDSLLKMEDQIPHHADAQGLHFRR